MSENMTLQDIYDMTATKRDFDKLTPEEIEEIRQKHREAAYKRVQILNADTGKLDQPFCKFCLNKGYTVGLRNGIELVSHPCSCQQDKEDKHGKTA